MKILVNDCAGHAFPFQLSRALARMGHSVVHAYFADLSAPRGAAAERPDDPDGFSIVPITTGMPFRKYDFLARIRQEREYARRVVALALRAKADVVLVSNTPDDALAAIAAGLPAGMRLVYWAQDIYSLGIRMVLNRKLPFAGTLVGAFYRAKERRVSHRADHIVAITHDFLPYFDSLGVSRDKVSVIENWAPLDEIRPAPPDTAWKHAQGLKGKTVALYSGTLGLKHNPSLLAQAAAAFKDRADIAFVVISEGLGARYLAEQKTIHALDNLTLLPWQPYESLSQSLSSGDLLMAIIEKDASAFSVPSKILSALCVGRPLVASIPRTNLAARTVLDAKAGLVSEPHDSEGFIANLKVLLDDPAMRARMGADARRYAERAFDIAPIALRFEALLRP